MNAGTMIATTLIMAGVMGVVVGSFSHTGATREAQRDPVYPAVWLDGDRGWRTSEPGMRYAAGGVGKGEPTGLDALFQLHLLVATQVSGNYLWTIQANIPGSHQSRLDFTDADSGRLAADALSENARDSLQFRAMQHLCAIEQLPATACYRKIHQSPGA